VNSFFQNSAVRLIHLDQGTQAWHDWRNGADLPDKKPRVTATLAAVISGTSVAKTSPYQAWLEMTGRKPKEEPSDFLRRVWAHGEKLEPIARQAYIDETGNMVMPACIQHPHHPWAAASLDGMTRLCEIILEIKCPISQRKHSIAKAGFVPDEYKAQCAWQLFCNPEAHEVHFFSYFEDDEAGQTTALVVFQRDKAYEEWLFNECWSWRVCLVKDTPPLSDSWMIAAANFRRLKQEAEESNEALAQAERALMVLLPDGVASHEGAGVKVTRYAGKAGVDYDGLIKSLNLPADEVQKALDSSRAPGPIDYGKALLNLQVAPDTLQELEVTFAKAGKLSTRFTLLKNFDSDVEPVAPAVTPKEEIDPQEVAATSQWAW
jgi:putative phage-type endonuclease